MCGTITETFKCSQQDTKIKFNKIMAVVFYVWFWMLDLNIWTTKLNQYNWDFCVTRVPIITFFFNLYIDNVIHNWQMNLLKHFMIHNSAVDRLLLADWPGCPIELGKWLTDGCTLIVLIILECTHLHTKDQGDGFLWSRSHMTKNYCRCYCSGAGQ